MLSSVSFLTNVPNALLVSNKAFPRLEILRVLLSSMSRYPQLSKSAASALVDITSAIGGTATTQERAILIRGALAQESYVRNACLQAIQVILLPLRGPYL